MQKIPLSAAAADMVLGRDVFREDNPGGIPICGKGMKLTDALIERLKRMGVQSITVEGEPLSAGGGMTPEERLLALDRRFRKVADDAYTQKMLNAYRKLYERNREDKGGGEAH